VPATAKNAPPDAEYGVPRQDVDGVIKALKSDARVGLTDEDRARLEGYGHNEMIHRDACPSVAAIPRSIQGLAVLLVATAVSAALWAIDRDAALPYEAIATLGAVLLNAMMGCVQQSQAEAAVAAVRAMSAADATCHSRG
jgi:Ca2+-transporting ATPase